MLDGKEAWKKASSTNLAFVFVGSVRVRPPIPFPLSSGTGVRMRALGGGLRAAAWGLGKTQRKEVMIRTQSRNQLATKVCHSINVERNRGVKVYGGGRDGGSGGGNKWTSAVL